MDPKYNRYKLLECILKEATPKGERIFVFSIFLAIAIPTVFKEDGLQYLSDIVEAVEQYIRRVGEGLETVWKSLNGSADSLVVQLIVPVYRTAGTCTPDNPSAFQDGDGGVLPGVSKGRVFKYRDFGLAVLSRDKYKCTVTGKFDTDAETGTVYKVVHIIPWGPDWNTSRSKETRNRLTWNLLDIFTANGSGRLSDTLSMNLDEVGNGLTLDREVYRRFEGLQFWLDFETETEADSIYTVEGDTKGIFGPGGMPPDTRVYLGKGRHVDRRLLDIHARLSRVSTVSGAVNVAKEFTGKGATEFVEHGPDHKSVHPKALELKLLSINELENKNP
ncbi:uncharacterized protein DFL_004085 [Arthrobotrys flagrans]|uniref:HNH nuclease domain-containing protein n=1 Tax=Arthrobotrys flagrans TaxID=97331 RepID=A0A437A3T7_ARTFL|nr:hypothetical protein DFL_004085 [Arthrobotrys flagrans]